MWRIMQILEGFIQDIFLDLHFYLEKYILKEW